MSLGRETAAPVGGQAPWRWTSRRADAWRQLGASEFLCRAIRFGIRDMPSVPFTDGCVLGEIPQKEADLEFGREDLRAGCAGGVYEEVFAEEAAAIVRSGKMCSSAFVVWQGEGEKRKGRFVVNFKRQSTHWPKGSVKMETLPAFALDLHQGDALMSWDVKGGYRHMYLHPDVRDMFLFRYDGRYYRCIALPFGWGRSCLWFTKLMRPLVQHLRENMEYRVMAYIDDFAAAPSPHGTTATFVDCKKAGEYLEALFGRLGVVRATEKGCWEGTKKLEHLGMLVDTEAMRVYITDGKLEKVRGLAKKLLLSAQRNARLVPLELLRHFCGVCVSLSLAVPLARFYTRSLYFDMTLVEKQERRARDWLFPGDDAAAHLESLARGPRQGRAQSGTARVRLSRQALRDLRHWRVLSRGEGRELQPSRPAIVMHSDAADVGYGGTLGFDEVAGSPGLWEGQGIWAPTDRAESITLRELRAVRLLLSRHFAAYVTRPGVQKLLLHEDNQAVVYVLNAMVSASPAMMVELRRLEKLLKALGVTIEARWLPSAVNKFADALSRTWDPGDAQATAALVQSVSAEYRLSEVVFRERPLGESYIARSKYLATQMREDWGDGRCRLWNAPWDALPLVVRKIEHEGGQGVVLAPHWPAQPWYSRLVAVSARMTVLPPPEPNEPALLQSERRRNDQWGMVIAELL